MVGEGHALHAEVSGLFHEERDAAQAVKEAVLGMEMKVCVQRLLPRPAPEIIHRQPHISAPNLILFEQLRREKKGSVSCRHPREESMDDTSKIC